MKKSIIISVLMLLSIAVFGQAFNAANAQQAAINYVRQSCVSPRHFVTGNVRCQYFKETITASKKPIETYESVIDSTRYFCTFGGTVIDSIQYISVRECLKIECAKNVFPSHFIVSFDYEATNKFGGWVKDSAKVYVYQSDNLKESTCTLPVAETTIRYMYPNGKCEGVNKCIYEKAPLADAIAELNDASLENHISGGHTTLFEEAINVTKDDFLKEFKKSDVQEKYYYAIKNYNFEKWFLKKTGKDFGNASAYFNHLLKEEKVWENEEIAEHLIDAFVKIESIRLNTIINSNDPNSKYRDKKEIAPFTYNELYALALYCTFIDKTLKNI